MTSPTPHLINALEQLDAGAGPEVVEFRHPRDGEQPTHQLITLDDGTRFTVRVGNRDLVAWDRSSAARKYPRESHPFIFANFLAYNAARREAAFEGTFDGPGGWLDRAEELTPLVRTDEEGEAGPTRPAAR